MIKIQRNNAAHFNLVVLRNSKVSLFRTRLRHFLDTRLFCGNTVVSIIYHSNIQLRI